MLTKAIENTLAACAVAIYIASNALLDLIIVDSRIQKSFDTGLEAQIGIVDESSRLDEFGKTHADDVYFLKSGHYRQSY